MSAPQVSLVIVSKGRPEHLAALLQSLRHQTCENFEVVLVADHRPDNFPDIRFIPFDIPNISAARNLGVSSSAGQLIAFCDDDAIPDPPWLERLIAPFTNPDVGASTGFTRGRNGISRQWGAMRFNRSGCDLPFEIDEDAPFQVYPPNPKRPIKLLGTGMAFRKSALLGIGGFDENFRFFLDETDAKLRLDVAGWKSAIVPNAQVHHQFAPSPRRQANRVPTDLFEIGASKAYFCAKHTDDSTQALQYFTQEQSDRLDRLKVKEAARSALLHSLAAGYEDGLKRQVPLANLQGPPEFKPFKTNATSHIVLCAGPFDDAWLKTALTEHLNDSHCVSVIKMQASLRYFQVRFQGGYWLHEGGAYGKSIRSQPNVQLGTFTLRFEREVERIATLYPVSQVLRAPNRTPVRLSASNPHRPA